MIHGSRKIKKTMKEVHIMKLEELKAFEAAHPEYKPLFRPIMTEFDRIAKEEFEKAFKAIDERMLALRKEHVEKYHVPEEDVKVIVDSMNEFVKQINADFRKNVHMFFEQNKP